MDVNRLEVQLPIGEWGGEVGSLMGTDFRAAFTRLLEDRTSLAAEDRRDLLQRVQEELRGELPVIVFAFIMQRYLVEGLTMGAVK